MIFEAGDKVVIGDSLTDCGRRGPFAPHGNGYLSLMWALVTAHYPERGVRFVNRGVSGDIVRDLAARWETDVIAERPDWLAVLIGINDVWRRFGPTPHEAVPPDEFAATLSRLLDRAAEQVGRRLIVIEPYLIETDPAGEQRAATDELAWIARDVGERRGAIGVRTRRRSTACCATPNRTRGPRTASTPTWPVTP